MYFRKVHPALGSTPGSLLVAAESFPPTIEVIDFGPGQHDLSQVSDPEQLSEYLTSPTTTWIDVQGLGDHAILQRLADVFSIHPLALEDAVNVPVRPKSEVYEGGHLVVLRMVRLLDGGKLERSQVTLYIGEHTLLSLQERPGDVFDVVAEGW